MTTTSRARSSSGLWFLAVATLAGCCWLAVETYRARRSPETVLDAASTATAHLAPSAPALTARARERLESALAALNDRSRPPAERLRVHREHLQAVEGLLVASLQARPTQARALALLAAVRWELDPPVDEEAVARHLSMIEQSARLAPAAADVQRDLGALLLRMTRPAEAVAYLRRAAELRPQLAGELVGILRNANFGAAEIHEALPEDPASLYEMHLAYFDEGLESEYIDVLERHSVTASPDLMDVYAAAHRRLGAFERLRERLEALETRSAPGPEARRLLHLSRTQVRLNANEAALEQASRARALMRDDVELAENLGYVALAAGRGETALDALGDALTIAARQSASARSRARIYRRIGQAEELRGRMDRAYEAYRKALELDPREPVAAKRFSEMRSATGVAP